LLQGPLRRYRAISAEAVAAATLALLKKKESGIFIHENTEMVELSE
jgi:hypothetical protein